MLLLLMASRKNPLFLALSTVWKHDFKQCLTSTFWFGWVLHAAFVGLGILAHLYYPPDSVTPRIIEALFDLILGLLLSIVIFASYIKNPSPVLMIQNNLKQVAIEFFRTILRVLIGFLLLILPGIYLTVKYLFVPFVVMGSRDYQAGKLDALKASWEMTKGITCSLVVFYLISQSLVSFLEIGLAPTIRFLDKGLVLSTSQELLISTLGQLVLSYPIQVFLYLVIARIFFIKMEENSKSAEVPHELAIQLARN